MEIDLFSIKQESDQATIALVDLEPFLVGNDAVIPENKSDPCSGYKDPNHEDHKFGCRFCPISYQSQRQLMGHVRNIHKGDLEAGQESIYEKACQPMGNSEFRCKLCDDKQNYNYPDFKRHVYADHESNKVCQMCMVCGGFFATAQALQKHTANKHSKENKATRSFRCEDCGMEFHERRYLQNHLHAKHNGPLPKNSSFFNKECEVCGKRLKNAGSLWAHKRIKHHVELNLPQKFVTPNGGEPHHCSQCSKTFKWASNLSRHRRQVHEKVKYTCKICEKVFGSRQAVYSHSFSHTDRMRYSCTEPQCRFKTMLKNKYIEHLKNDHGVTTFDPKRHDPLADEFSYKKMIESCCDVRFKAELDHSLDSELDSD